MQINEINKFGVLVLGVVLPAIALGCKFDPQVDLVGIDEIHKLDEVTKPGDQFTIKCNGAVQTSGAVNNNHNLVLSNGANINVIGMVRSRVLSELRGMHSMLNTPNGIQLRAK